MYGKHFIPLDADPSIFTHLLHDLGVQNNLHFGDVLSLDDPSSLPRPALALILIFPTSTQYETRKATEEAVHHGDDGDAFEGITWFRQSINNACGLYAVLHAIYNSSAGECIRSGSLLADILADPARLNQRQRCEALERSEELERVYARAAALGMSTPPLDPEEEVDYHFITFVKHVDGRVFELDGDRKCPVYRDAVIRPGEDMLSSPVRGIIKGIIQQEGGENDEFSLMALSS